MKNILLITILFFILNCSTNKVSNSHGFKFVEKNFDKIILNKSNKNDVIKIIGRPHSKSIDDENMWIYLERTLSKGKYHKLGQHVLKKNNTLVLKFDKFGILKSKKIFDINDTNKVAFSSKETKNELTQKSFVESFLSSVKQKMYGNRK